MNIFSQFLYSLLKRLRLLLLWLRHKPGTALGQGAHLAYVVNENDDTVSVIDTANHVVVVTVPVGLQSRCIAITPDGLFAFVTNHGSGDLSVIRTLSNTVVGNVAISAQPLGIAITPHGNKAYVALPNDQKVAVVNISPDGFGILAGFVNVGIGPGFVAVTPNGQFAYVTNSISDTVSVIDTVTDTVVVTVPLPKQFRPVRIAFTLDGLHAYVACVGASNTLQIDTNNNQVNIQLWFNNPLGQCFGVAVTPVLVGSDVYITDSSNVGEVTVVPDQSFDDNSVITQVQVGGNPNAVAVTPNGDFAYVTCSSTNDVAAIDTRTLQVVTKIKVGKAPFGIAMMP